MDTITIRFTTHWPPNPASLAIARLSGSRRFSHSLNIIGDIAYEASMLHGCRVVPVVVAMKGVAFYQDMAVPVPNIAAAREWGEQQDGKPYDWGGAAGIPLLMSEHWSDESKWWCSELSFMQILKGGMTLLDPNACRRVTPEHLRMCNYPKTAVMRWQPNTSNQPPTGGFSF